MNEPPVRYGPHSPFDPQERETIERICNRVKNQAGTQAEELVMAIRRQMVCLEWLGQVLSEYPSPLASQTLGSRHRGLDTLVDSLSHTNPANFEFHVPTRALLGRALVMAESNFYRLLRHICGEIFAGPEGQALREEASERLHICLYTKLVEEVLSTIASDDTLDRDVRSKAVVALAQTWERRLNYRVRDFFPLLEATWEARQTVTVTGGTLSGTQEIFELFQAGCDPDFVGFFARPNPTEDELEAFREFLFGTSTEELDRLAHEMAAQGISSIRLHDANASSDRDAATVFYEFFRSRHLLALGRRLANLPGPKRTAEGYVMIYYLSRTS